jgi:predicted oxidoreductase
MSTRREFLTQAVPAGLLAIAPSQFAQADPVMAEARSTKALKTYRIPQTDLTVSRLAFGCAVLGIDWNSAEFTTHAASLIRVAYEHGITFFDLADVYGVGKAEIALGQVLKATPGLRNRIVIQTKCGERFQEAGTADNSREHITRSVDGSLKRLGIDHVDILLLHFPDSLVEPDEVARAFDELKRTGKVRYFGVSNHGSVQIELLQKSVREPLIFNQIQLGLAHWNILPEGGNGGLTHGDEGATTLDYCRAHDIRVQAYSPLRASEVIKQPNLLNPGPDATPEVNYAVQLLAHLAQKNEVVPAAVMLAWLLHHPAGIIPIIGGTKADHIIENCAADHVELTRVEWYSLLRAAAAIYPPKAA